MTAVAACRLRLAACALGGLLAGCSAVGPDYVAPPLPAGISAKPSTSFEASHSAAFSQAPLPPHWWRLYTDPRLDALVQQALHANTDLRVAAANLERARAAEQEARASAGVQTSIDGGVSSSKSSTLGIGASEASHGLLDIGLGISYEVDIAGRIRRTIEASSASTQAQAAAYDLARTTIAANVVGAYTNACAAGASLAVARRSVSLQHRSLALTERGAKAGIYSPLDVTRLRALLDQLESALAPLEATRRTALYSLAVLTGRAPADFPAELATCATIPRLDRPLPVGDGAALIRRRPDIRQSERELAAATATIGVETAALYPTISFGASVGTTSRLNSDPLSGSAIHYSLGPLISWTFPNRQVARARINEAGAAARAALAKFDGAVLGALQETESALTLYARHLEENDRLRAARDEDRLAARLQARLARAGTVSGLEALDVERTLASADSALAASDTTLAADRVRIFLALGGGWEVNVADPALSL